VGGNRGFKHELTKFRAGPTHACLTAPILTALLSSEFGNTRWRFAFVFA